MPETETLSRTLCGVEASVAESRHVAAAFAGDLARLDDLLMVVSELATNAVLHSLSRAPGGEFQLQLKRTEKAIMVHVVDQGPAVKVRRTGDAFAPGEDPAFPHGESGRGLMIVDALADDWGHEQDQDHATWWAELWIKEQ